MVLPARAALLAQKRQEGRMSSSFNHKQPRSEKCLNCGSARRDNRNLPCFIIPQALVFDRRGAIAQFLTPEQKFHKILTIAG